ncbi:hypothetical protein ACFQ10_50260 [Streptomyces indonesiensis]
MEALFGIYGVDTPIPDLDAGTAAREVPAGSGGSCGPPLRST